MNYYKYETEEDLMEHLVKKLAPPSGLILEIGNDGKGIFSPIHNYSKKCLTDCKWQFSTLSKGSVKILHKSEGIFSTSISEKMFSPMYNTWPSTSNIFCIKHSSLRCVFKSRHKGMEWDTSFTKRTSKHAFKTKIVPR